MTEKFVTTRVCHNSYLRTPIFARGKFRNAFIVNLTAVNRARFKSGENYPLIAGNLFDVRELIWYRADITRGRIRNDSMVRQSLISELFPKVAVL